MPGCSIYQSTNWLKIVSEDANFPALSGFAQKWASPAPHAKTLEEPHSTLSAQLRGDAVRIRWVKACAEFLSSAGIREIEEDGGRSKGQLIGREWEDYTGEKIK